MWWWYLVKASERMACIWDLVMRAAWSTASCTASSHSSQLLLPAPSLARLAHCALPSGPMAASLARSPSASVASTT